MKKTSRILLSIMANFVLYQTILAVEVIRTDSGSGRNVEVWNVDVPIWQGAHVSFKNITPIDLWISAEETGTKTQDKCVKIASGETIKAKFNDTDRDVVAYSDEKCTNPVSVRGRIDNTDASGCACGSCYGDSPLGTAGGCG